MAIAMLAVFTRLLSPSEYGVYAVGMAIATVVSAIFFEWLNVAVGRFYQMHLDDPSKVMSVAARGFGAATAVVALFFLGALAFHPVFNMDSSTIGIVIFITVALGRHNLALHVANAQGAPVRYGMLVWVKSGGGLLAGFILIYNGAGGRGALLGALLGLVVAVIACAPKLPLNAKLKRLDSGLLGDLLRYGLPLTMSYLAMVIVDMADRFMIGSLLGVAHVASYAVAYDLVQQSVGPIMHVIFLAAFPVVVQVFEKEGSESARPYLLTLGSNLVALGLPAAVGIGVLAGDISDIVFGSDYRQDAATIMPWLAAAICVGAFKSYFLDVVFQLRHATKYQGYIALMMAAVNIVLNLILLPRFGVIAAAWATLAAFSVGALVSWVVGKSVFALPPLGHVILGSAIASAVMAIVILLLPASPGIVWLLVKVVLGLAAYVVMAWVLDVAGCRRMLKAWPIFQ